MFFSNVANHNHWKSNLYLFYSQFKFIPVSVLCTKVRQSSLDKKISITPEKKRSQISCTAQVWVLIPTIPDLQVLLLHWTIFWWYFWLFVVAKKREQFGNKKFVLSFSLGQFNKPLIFCKYELKHECFINFKTTKQLLVTHYYIGKNSCI